MRLFWLPLTITIAYLLITLILFAAGPIYFYIQFPFTFYCYMTSYLFSIIFGYSTGRVLLKRIHTIENATLESVTKNKRTFILFAAGALVASSIGLRINSIFGIFDFKYWGNIIINGLFDPGSQYAQKMDLAKIAQSDKKLHTILFLFAPFRILFVTLLIAYWKKKKFLLKLIGLILVFILYLAPALQTGTNKPVFDLFIFTTVSLLSIIIRNIKNNVKNAKRKFKFIISVSLLLAIIAFGFFSLTTTARGGQSTYIETTSRSRDISVRPEFRESGSRVKELYVWFVSYLVQGYYGFALSLREDFTTTYGIGNSIFLTRQIEYVTGLNIFDRTYQYKINSNWDAYAQWHSFYAYFANDYHFLGVIIICFLLGTFLSIIWYTYLWQSNIWSLLMLPLLAVMIIFIPANNQLFSFLENFASFHFVLFGWLFSIRISKLKHEVER